MLLALTAGALVPASPAGAACAICDEVIEFDRPRAHCFTSGYERYLEAARNAPTRAAEIDLTDCTGTSGDDTRGLERMRTLPLSPADEPAAPAAIPDLRSVYILDEAGIVCLGRLIESHRGAFDPARFDLYESCGQ